MPDRALAALDNQNPVLRQLKLLVVLLVLSNVGLGLFGFYVLRQVDRRYSELIARAVPSLNELQTLTALETEAMRSTNPTLFAEAPQGRAEMVRRARLALGRDRDLRQHALEREWLAVKPDERPNFEGPGDAFSQKAQEVVGLLEAGDDAAANKLRETSLRPAFDRYIAATTRIADVLEEESLRTSNQFTEQTGSMSHMLLGLASWPVMLISLFFLVAILFVIGVLLKVAVSRGAEA